MIGEYWFCIVGPAKGKAPPDSELRHAIRDIFMLSTEEAPEFIFSGWVVSEKAKDAMLKAHHDNFDWESIRYTGKV